LAEAALHSGEVSQSLVRVDLVVVGQAPVKQETVEQRVKVLQVELLVTSAQKTPWQQAVAVVLRLLAEVERLEILRLAATVVMERVQIFQELLHIMQVVVEEEHSLEHEVAVAVV
jgi:hypothetical protein